MPDSQNPRSVDLAALRALGDDTTLNNTERVLVWDAIAEIERLRERGRRDRNVINLIRAELAVDDDLDDYHLPTLISDLIGLDDEDDDG